MVEQNTKTTNNKKYTDKMEICIFYNYFLAKLVKIEICSLMTLKLEKLNAKLLKKCGGVPLVAKIR